MLSRLPPSKGHTLWVPRSHTALQISPKTRALSLSLVLQSQWFGAQGRRMQESLKVWMNEQVNKRHKWQCCLKVKQWGSGRKTRGVSRSAHHPEHLAWHLTSWGGLYVHTMDSEDTTLFLRASAQWASRASCLWPSHLAGRIPSQRPQDATTERWGSPPGPVWGWEEAVVTEACPFLCPTAPDHVPLVRAHRDLETPNWNGGARVEGSVWMQGHQPLTHCLWADVRMHGTLSHLMQMPLRMPGQLRLCDVLSKSVWALFLLQRVGSQSWHFPFSWSPQTTEQMSSILRISSDQTLQRVSRDPVSEYSCA